MPNERQQVREAAAAQGVEAAVKLATGTFNWTEAWARRFLRQEAEKHEGRKPLGPVRTVKLAKGETYVPQKRDRVRLRYDDDNTWGPGTIIEAGPEQSSWQADKDRQLRISSNRNLVPV